MKKTIIQLFIIAVACVAMFACTKKEAKPYIVQYTNQLVEKYPNYKSNEKAREILMDSVHAKAQTYVGKDASLFDGVEFDFVKLIDNEHAGTTAALFRTKHLISDIESDANGGKYVTSTIDLLVLGTVDSETATALGSGYTYSISGTVHAVDEVDQFYVKSDFTDIFFGTFIMDNMTVTKIESKK